MKSDKEYEIRFGVVMAMAHYIDEEYINNVLQWMDRISHEGYYVKMAVAWALSVCYVKFPQKTVNYLKENHIDDFTYNKALQKIIESYRVSTEDKEIIRSMKRKTNNVHYLPQRGFESFRKKFTIHIRKDSNCSSSY